MEMKVEVISKETIKPSSLTPQHLKTYNLSLLDQIAPPFYVPLIFFYGAAADGTDYYDRCGLLKRSLSETLTRFYPVAGRLQDNSINVDCNDEGVDYTEARINCTMSDLMSNVDVLYRLIPHHVAANNYLVIQQGAQLAVQVNMFDCGGIAITVCMSHKIADASTIITFIDAWAATSRGATEIIYPTFDSASLFPSCQGLVVPSLGPKPLPQGQRVVAKRFIFDAAKIATLRAKIKDVPTSTINNPTRVEAVSALIWKSAMEAKKGKCSGSSSKTSSAAPVFVVNHAMNLRGRMEPPLANVSFGNMIKVATTSTGGPGVRNHELDGLAGQLRDAFKKINSDYIQKVLQSGEFLRHGVDECKPPTDEEDNAVEKVESEVFWMSSWCRYPVYEADFGWGKPTWVSTCFESFDNKLLLIKNLVILMDTRCGEGIEAWVTLLEEDMALFEHNLELLCQTPANIVQN